VTVEEVLLAIVAAAALVLLFLGLAEVLEADAYARLRARRRQLARAGIRPGRPAPPPPPRPALARRPMGPSAARPLAVGRPAAAVPAAGAGASAPGLDGWRDGVAALIRERKWDEARRLVDPALTGGELSPERAGFLLEVCSTGIARDLWRLRRAARHGSGGEAPFAGALEMTRTLLESPAAAALPATQRRRVARRLWRGQARLGLRRWRAGEFDEAAECFFQAVAGPGIDERRRRLARDLLVRTLEDLAGLSLEVIPQLLDDGDRAAAVERAHRLLDHIRRAREEGVTTEDLAVSASRARQLLGHIEPSPAG
jgi:hypothetical protein